MEPVHYTHRCHESEALSGVLLAKPTLIIDNQRVYLITQLAPRTAA